MERALARLAAAASGASARDGAGIVLYEDAARRRVTVLAGALRALRTLSDVAQEFKGVQQTPLHLTLHLCMCSAGRGETLTGNPKVKSTSEAGCVSVPMAHIRQFLQLSPEMLSLLQLQVPCCWRLMCPSQM